MRDASVVSVLNLWRRKHGFCGDLLMALAGVHNNGVQAQSYRCKARSIIDHWCKIDATITITVVQDQWHHHQTPEASVFQEGRPRPSFLSPGWDLPAFQSIARSSKLLPITWKRTKKHPPTEVNRKKQTICNGRILHDHKHNQPLHSYSS